MYSQLQKCFGHQLVKIKVCYGSPHLLNKIATLHHQVHVVIHSYGLQHGLGDEELQSCLKDEDSHNRLLSLQVDAQNIFGVESTPTFLINGEKVQGNRPASEFIKIIKKKLNN